MERSSDSKQILIKSNQINFDTNEDNQEDDTDDVEKKKNVEASTKK